MKALDMPRRAPTLLASRLLMLPMLLLALAGPAVAATCGVTAVPLAFGVYSPGSLIANTSTGTVMVTCLAAPTAVLQSYQLTLSTGASASYATRKLVSGSRTINYQLHSDPAMLFVWGDGSAGTVAVNGSLLLSVVSPASASHTVYGRMPASQSAAYPGAYLDTVTVTIVY